LHAAVGARHVGGEPVHDPAQQSAVVVHDASSAAHAAALQNDALFGPGSHVPRQHSLVAVHGAPGGRHAPGPGSQRPAVVHVAEQQPGPPPELQSSPDGLHAAAVSSWHLPWRQSDEQHCASVVQSSPVRVQSVAAAHDPDTHASVQQSCARAHASPVRLQ
jgi:hypothetical protein